MIEEKFKAISILKLNILKIQSNSKKKKNDFFNEYLPVGFQQDRQQRF